MHELSHVVPLSPWPACAPGYPWNRPTTPGGGDRLRFPYSNQDGLEVLAGSTSSATVDVALEPVDELVAAALDNLGLEIAAIVDDDENRRGW